MRFKKLRLSVGIALILFILIAGNIIAFGKLVDKKPIVQSNNSDTILVDPKQIAPKKIQTETKPIQPIVEVQNSSLSAPIEQPKVVEPTPPPPKPVVVHHQRRTRAS